MKKSALVLACDDRFIPYTSIIARQIARQTNQYFHIFILSDRVSQDDKKSARNLCSRIDFIEVSEIFPNNELPTGLHFSRAAYARLLLDEILDFDQAVYIDSDVTVLSDIAPLLTMRLVAPVAAGYDFGALGLGDSDFPHLNSGVAVFDLGRIRSEGIFRKALNFAIENPEKCTLVDQDALNHVLRGGWQILDWRWNLHGPYAARARSLPFIRHFTGPHKPWSPTKFGIERRYVDAWRRELRDSPWPDRFYETPWRTRICLRPFFSAIEERVRIARYGNSPGRKGEKVRFAMRFDSVLREISEHAAMNRTADSAVLEGSMLGFRGKRLAVA